MNYFEPYTNRKVWLHLARRDLKSRYKHTLLGPWWSASSLAVIVCGITLSTSVLSGQSAIDHAPRIAISMAIWTLASSMLTEAPSMLEADRSILLNSMFTEQTMVSRLMFRNFLIYMHNWVVVVGAYLFSQQSFVQVMKVLLAMFVAGIALMALMFFPLVFVSRLGILFRDSQIFVISATQLGFFVTPIFWNPPKSGVARHISDLNPFGWIIIASREYSDSGFLDQAIFIRFLILITAVVGIGYTLMGDSTSIKKYM